MTAQFKFTTRCGICNEFRSREYPIASGMELPLPALPEDWKILDGVPICHKHKVIVKTPKALK